MMSLLNLPKLGIVAGSGQLPREIIQTCQAQGRPFLVVAYEGHTDLETYQNIPHFKARLGKVSEVIHKMKEMGVQELVLVGRFRRPSWLELKPDALAAKWLAGAAKSIFGDDSLLQIVLKNLEAEGFIIRSAEDILGSKLLAPFGLLGKHSPGARAALDIPYGIKVAKALGAYDVGQSIIIQQGIVLGVEAIEGTDQLIKRCKLLKREGEGGILIKVIKPQQDIRIDRPTVGLETLKNAVDSGLEGIVLEAQEVIVHDLPEMIALADQHHIFMMGVDAT